MAKLDVKIKLDMFLIHINKNKYKNCKHLPLEVTTSEFLLRRNILLKIGEVKFESKLPCSYNNINNCDYLPTPYSVSAKSIFRLNRSNIFSKICLSTLKSQDRYMNKQFQVFKLVKFEFEVTVRCDILRKRYTLLMV